MSCSGMVLALMAAMGSVNGPPPAGAVEVRSVEELTAALASGVTHVILAPGRHEAGPEPLVVPDGSRISGSGAATLVAREGTEALVVMGNRTALSDLAIDGSMAVPGFVQDGLVVVPAGTEDVGIRGLRVTGCPRVCVLTDNARRVTVEGCVFEDVFGGVHLQFSNECRVVRNRITRARHHGVQIWGNWNWEERRSSDILVRGNIVTDVGLFEGEETERDRNGGGAIWAAGVERLRYEGNLVDGATDVGLDMEWCADGQITGNVSKRAKNGCISLFFSCSDIRIEGNVIENHWPQEPGPPEGFWTRAGVWLTPPNTADFPDDRGHSRIQISGNVIRCEPGPLRRAVWLPAGAMTDVTVEGNAITGGGLWVGDQLQEDTSFHAEATD
jgi:hypothetical protein